jgi:hypothetical protein
MEKLGSEEEAMKKQLKQWADNNAHRIAFQFGKQTITRPGKTLWKTALRKISIIRKIGTFRETSEMQEWINK